MMRFYVASVLCLAGAVGTYAVAQTPQPTPGLTLRADAVEFAVPGYKAGRNAAPATSLLLHNFTFEGQTIPVGNLHLQQLSEGVYELTGSAVAVGNWHFSVNGAADG